MDAVLTHSKRCKPLGNDRSKATLDCAVGYLRIHTRIEFATMLPEVKKRRSRRAYTRAASRVGIPCHVAATEDEQDLPLKPPLDGVPI